MNLKSVNIDYCGIVILLRQLVQAGKCTEREARKIANRISSQYGIDIILCP